MLNTAQLHDALTGLIGVNPAFSPTTLAERMRPDARHRQAEIMLSDAHKLLRTETLTALGPNLLTANPAIFDPEQEYDRYEIVSDSEGNYFESRINDNTQPLTDAMAWRPTTLLSAWISRLERGAINKLALLAGYAPPPPPLLDPMPLYQKGGNLQDSINKLGRFCGLRLTLKKSAMSLGLVHVGLQLSGPVTNFPIYVFRSDQAEPVSVLRLTTTTAGRMQWVPVGERLYTSSEVYLDGEYYLIGYFEQDLPLNVHAIDGQRSLISATCSSCNPYDVSLFNSREPFVTTESVYVDNVEDSRLLAWPLENRVDRQTWGLNLVIEAKCDVTRAVLSNREILLRALLYQMACDALEELSTSDRVNAVKETLKNQAYVALNGQGISTSDTGLKPLLAQAIKDYKAVLAKLMPACLPVAEQRTITFESF